MTTAREEHPDPTNLTTQQLWREVGALKELINVRLEAAAEAVKLLQQQANRSPSINEVFLQHEERFKSTMGAFDSAVASIKQQFAERDTRTEQTSRDSKVAVDAALQAAKEAVGEQNKSSALAIAKSEAATTKQIDQIGAIITATNSGLNDKIDDIKSRLTLIEGRTAGIAQGGTEVRKNTNDMGALVIAGVGVLVAIVAAGVAIAALVRQHP